MKKKTILGGKSPKKGGLDSLKKEGVMFLRGVETPMHTMSWKSLLIDTNIQSKQHCNTVILIIILTTIDT